VLFIDTKLGSRNWVPTAASVVVLKAPIELPTSPLIEKLFESSWLLTLSVV